MSTAGEGGAWGVALLAAYDVRSGGLALDEWLDKEVFHTGDASADAGETIAPDPADVAGFDKYMERYIEGLKIERAAVDHLK
jgi:sugar (pentulose or hexulose) kinase